MAASSVTITARYADQYTLDQLSRMIRERSKVMKYETTEHAVRATAINVLTSLAAQTKQKKRGKKVTVASGGGGGAATFKENHLYYTSYTKGGKRCIRLKSVQAARKGKLRGSRVPWAEHCVQLCDPAKRVWDKAKFFDVTLSDSQASRWTHQPQHYLVIAKDAATVKSYLQKRYTSIADKTMGAAKHALKLASAKVSDKPISGDPGGTNARRIAQSANIVRTHEGNNEFSLFFEDQLVYALDALKGGAASVNLAMQKAANRTAGIINNYIQKAGVFHERVETPFPEVTAKRAS